MNTLKRDLLKKLMLTTPDNGVVCAAFLKRQGFSYENLKGYVRSGYLDQLGRGAYCKHGNKPDVAAGVSALNHQLSLPVHVGGKTALAQRGIVHFVPFTEVPTSLFGTSCLKIPAWFTRYFDGRFSLTRTNLFADTEGVETRMLAGFEVKMSVPERAILELLYAVPARQMLNEAYQLLDMMTSVRPKLMQSLLAKCSSIKVKRLFFLLAESTGHEWFNDLDCAGIDLGNGCRVIDPGGTFNGKWQVVVKDWREI